MYQILKNRKVVKKFKILKKLIQNSKRILISGHVNTDGDNIASQLALSRYLESINKDFNIVWNDEIPENYSFLKDMNKIKNFKQIEDFNLYDLVIILDSGDIKRIGEVAKFITDKKIINIDHHKDNTNFGYLNIVLNATSIGEILYYFFLVNNIKIDKDIAFYLYFSIVSDTGFFRFDAVHPDIHLIAYDLLKYGINNYQVNFYIYQSKSISFIKYLSLILNRISFSLDNKVCYSYLLYEDFNEEKNIDTDSLVEYLGIVKSVSVYYLIKEKEKGIFNVSIRSKFDVDVSKVAFQFGGGGHKRAAGFRTGNISLENLIEKINENLKKEF